jgi:hypothetical protein
VLVSGLMGWWWRFMGDMPRAVGMGLVLAAVAAGPLASLLVPDEGVLAQCLLAGSPLTIAHEVLRDRSWTGLSAMPQPAHAWTIAGTMAGGLVLCWSASGRVAVRGGPA